MKKEPTSIEDGIGLPNGKISIPEWAGKHSVGKSFVMHRLIAYEINFRDFSLFRELPLINPNIEKEMKKEPIILDNMDHGTTVTDLAMQKAAELQHEVIVLDEKNKMQFTREVTIPITAIPDNMIMHEEPKIRDLRPFYHRFNKNHRKKRR